MEEQTLLPHIDHIIDYPGNVRLNESELGCVLEEAGFDTIEEPEMVVENNWEAIGNSSELQVPHGKGVYSDNQTN